jgi:hypothetical protein
MATEHELDGFRDFVASHYALSSRDDTPYWKFLTQNKSFKDMDPNGHERYQNGLTFKHDKYINLISNQDVHVLDKEIPFNV